MYIGSDDDTNYSISDNSDSDTSDLDNTDPDLEINRPNQPNQPNQPNPWNRNLIFLRLTKTLPLGVLLGVALLHTLFGSFWFIILPGIVEGVHYFRHPIALILVVNFALTLSLIPLLYILRGNLMYVSVIAILHWFVLFCAFIAISITVYFVPPTGITITVLTIAVLFEFIPFYILSKWIVDACINIQAWNYDY